MNPTEIRKDIRRLLEREKIGYLCTSDDRGMPHITPMFFLYSFDTHELYFITDRKTRKVSNLLKVTSLAFTVDIRDRKNPFNNRGVLLRGELMKLTDLSLELSDKSRRALKMFSEKYKGVIDIDVDVDVEAPREILVTPQVREETAFLRRFHDVLCTCSIYQITYWKGPFSKVLRPGEHLILR